MLKTILNSFSAKTRIVFRSTSYNSVRKLQFNNENKKKKSNKDESVFVLTSVPTFLAFFQKKEDENDEPSFLEKVLPDDIALLLKKKPVEDENTPEQLLTNTLKRTILCIHRQQYEKAEQMAHLALRMAQDIKSYDGITFCFDIMANIAFERNQYEKAEKLFESVLQRLLLNGVPQDDIQVLHLSLKVAQIVELQNKTGEAKTNYVWTLSKLAEKKRKEPENTDLFELWGLANNLYGKFLLNHGSFKEAVEKLKVSHDVFLQVHGRKDPDYINILNDLAVASLHVNDFHSADFYIDEALILASVYPEMLETGIYHANKALICLKKGLLSDAQKLCNHADKASTQSGDLNGKEQAKYCAEQIEIFMKNIK